MKLRSKIKYTPEMLERIFTNPYYCMKIDPSLSDEHEFLVTEEEWVKANESLIKEIGLKKWLVNLLENLKGNWVDNEGNIN